MTDFSFCYSLPSLYALAFVVLFFVIAYLSYRLTLFVLLKFFAKEGLVRQSILALKRALLFFALEIAAFMSLELITVHFVSRVQHILVVLFILTIGYGVASLARVFYLYGMKKYATDELDKIAQRSTMTQIHFIYRLGIFTIIILTVAIILTTFPNVKSLGIGLLGSAGIAGIALGIAARPILLNLMAGIQIALTKTLKIGDVIIVEGESVNVEDIHLTYLVAKTSDLRRFIIPISYFIDHSFQNLSSNSAELVGTVFLYCDYSIAVDAVRKKFQELLQQTEYFNGNKSALHVTQSDEKSVQLRLTMTAKDDPSAFQLRAFIREKMIEFIQKEHPDALPKFRTYLLK